MQQEIEGRLIGQVIKIDEAPISYHLGKVVRETVEETLNASSMLRPARCAELGATSVKPVQ